MVTGAAKRCGRSTSKRIAAPSVWLRGVNPYFSRALLLVTSGSVFWIVAVGPEKTAIRGLAFPLVVAIKGSVLISKNAWV
jgi:hypothetical protein